MGEAFRGPGGGLPAEARALMMPGNIREGIHIKGGGLDVTGSYKGAIFVYLGLSGGVNGSREWCVYTSPIVITTMVAPSISNDSNSFRGSVSIKANFKGRLQIVDDSGFQSISMTYGGISVNKSNKLSNVLDFTAGSAISVAGHMHPMDAARVGALGIVLAE